MMKKKKENIFSIIKYIVLKTNDRKVIIGYERRDIYIYYSSLIYIQRKKIKKKKIKNNDDSRLYMIRN